MLIVSAKRVWGTQRFFSIDYIRMFDFTGFLVGSGVKNLPAKQETQVQSLGQEDYLEKEMTIHSSILAWGNPMARGAWRAAAYGVTKSRARSSN